MICDCQGSQPDDVSTHFEPWAAVQDELRHNSYRMLILFDFLMDWESQ